MKRSTLPYYDKIPKEQCSFGGGVGAVFVMVISYRSGLRVKPAKITKKSIEVGGWANHGEIARCANHEKNIRLRLVLSLNYQKNFGELVQNHASLMPKMPLYRADCIVGRRWDGLDFPRKGRMQIKLPECLRRQLRREPVRRALRTFLQAAAGYVVVNIASLDFSARDAVLGFFVATVAAGIAATMNMEEDSDEDLS